MGFKNTIEIITKDIQELEKIVRNFENYSRIPGIDLDLALDKTRNLYELLLMIREYERESSQNDPPSKNKNEIQSGSHAEKPEQPATEESRGNIYPDKVEFIDENTQEENNKPVNEEKQAYEEKKTDPEPPVEKNGSSLKDKIIAEKFQQHNDFLNERIGGNKTGKDLSAKIQSTPIKSISGSMGINDKFFFIRELFNGNAENFHLAMKTLDDASNFNEAYNYLLNTFEWDMDSETVQQLLNLIRRKFISTGNG